MATASILPSKIPQSASLLLEKKENLVYNWQVKRWQKLMHHTDYLTNSVICKPIRSLYQQLFKRLWQKLIRMLSLLTVDVEVIRSCSCLLSVLLPATYTLKLNWILIPLCCPGLGQGQSTHTFFKQGSCSITFYTSFSALESQSRSCALSLLNFSQQEDTKIVLVSFYGKQESSRYQQKGTSWVSLWECIKCPPLVARKTTHWGSFLFWWACYYYKNTSRVLVIRFIAGKDKEWRGNCHWLRRENATSTVMSMEFLRRKHSFLEQGGLGRHNWNGNVRMCLTVRQRSWCGGAGTKEGIIG